MIERELSDVEVKEIYGQIVNDTKLKPFNSVVEGKCGEVYYELNGKQYRLIYDQNFDWFCDIIFEGEYALH